MNSFVLGLTGSIAMGKTTVSNMFRSFGYPVWCADNEVSELYKASGKGSRAIEKIFPTAVNSNGVSKEKLKYLISQNNDVLKEIEELIHPLLSSSRLEFQKLNSKKKIIVFDIPLLFEKNQDKSFNATLLLTASEEVQKKRALSRQGYSLEHFNFIKQRQLGEEEKIKRADHILFTDKPIDTTREEVKNLCRKLINNDFP